MEAKSETIKLPTWARVLDFLSCSGAFSVLLLLLLVGIIAAIKYGWLLIVYIWSRV